MTSHSNRIDNRKDLLLLLLFAPGQSNKENETISGRTRLMKLLYLFERELMDLMPSLRKVTSQAYSFNPYHYGPFSKDVFDDIAFLENVRMVEEEDEGNSSMAEIAETRLYFDDLMIDQTGSEEDQEFYLEPVFKLTEDRGVEFARSLFDQLSQNEKKLLSEFKARFNSLPLSTILRYVYANYPESAVKSRIRDSI